MAEPGNFLRLLQITDTHLFADPAQRMRGMDTSQTLQRVVSHARKHYPDASACLLTGDLSQDGEDGSYRLLKDLLGVLDMPLLAIPGNHDDKTLMARILDEELWQYCPVFDIGDWRIVCLDTAVEGAEHGHLDRYQLARMGAALDIEDRHVLVCVHHPPVAIGCRWLDRIGLANGPEFFDALDASASVRAVLWGHVHQEFSERRNGVTLLGTPSTCVQFMPGEDRFAVDPLEPGYRVLELGANGFLRSHVERVGI